MGRLFPLFGVYPYLLFSFTLGSRGPFIYSAYHSAALFFARLAPLGSGWFATHYPLRFHRACVHVYMYGLHLPPSLRLPHPHVIVPVSNTNARLIRPLSMWLVHLDVRNLCTIRRLIAANMDVLEGAVFSSAPWLGLVLILNRGPTMLRSLRGRTVELRRFVGI
jgi:hypothetical protein